MSSSHCKQLRLSWVTESIPLARAFKISRGTKTHADVVLLKIALLDKEGWAEAVPYSRYHESLDSTIELLSSIEGALSKLSNTNPISLIDEALNYVNTELKASSARNLLDCALWDLKAKLAKKSVNTLCNLAPQKQAISAQTLSVDNLDVMLRNAKKMSHLPLIKIKLDADDIIPKMQAIAALCPHSQFIIDANEAWSFTTLQNVVDDLAKLNVALIEQPLPAQQDDELIGFKSPIPLCADESCHTSSGMNVLVSKYNMVNIKLDKTGGLSEAIKLMHVAKAHKMQIMLGCMVASSLAMAPIYVLAASADFIDLDGPVLVLNDRPNGFIFEGATMYQSEPFLWGQG